MYHLYDNPPAAVAFADGMEVSRDALALAARDFDEFYEEIFVKLTEFGELEDLIVLDNINDHMIGNVYVKFVNEDDAEKSIRALNGKYYAGRLIFCEYSPVTDFREARCRLYNDSSCDRGGYCNFMHMKHISKSLKKELFEGMYKRHPEYKLALDER